MLLGWLITLLLPPGATIVFGADDTVERLAGRQIKAKGCDRDAVRSSKNHVIRGFGLTWVAMMLLVPVVVRKNWIFLLFGGYVGVPCVNKSDRRRRNTAGHDRLER